MKIGIFGDSFASMIRYEKNPTLSWIEILNQKYDVSCYGRPGTRLLYSVKKFKTCQDDYDKIVFVVTSPGRIELNDFMELPSTIKYITSLNNAETILRNNLPQLSKPEVKSAVETAVGYFKYLYDKQDEKYFHELMINDILSIRPDTILVPAFPNSLINPLPCISDITNLENDYWKSLNIDLNDFDYRYCHLSAENNKILAEKAAEWINGSPVVININDYVIPTSPMDYYFNN